MERAGRGRKARWVPGSCSAPPAPTGAQGCGGPSPSLAPVCSGRSLRSLRIATGVERQAHVFPWRPPCAMRSPLPFHHSAVCIPCLTCAPSHMFTQCGHGRVESAQHRWVFHTLEPVSGCARPAPRSLRAALLVRLVCVAP